MRVKKQSVTRDYLSCNFCNKGVLKTDAHGLSFPYDAVVEFSRDTGGNTPAICEECLDELYLKAKAEFKK